MREAFDPMETLAAGITKAVVRIKVVGVGGGGNSVLLRLSEDKIPGIELIAVNTDAKQLAVGAVKFVVCHNCRILFFKTAKTRYEDRILY